MTNVKNRDSKMGFQDRSGCHLVPGTKMSFPQEMTFSWDKNVIFQNQDRIGQKCHFPYQENNVIPKIRVKT